MKFKDIKFNRFLNDKDIFTSSVKKMERDYRPLEPGQFLYTWLLKKNKEGNIFGDEYLELVYATLIAWNMDGRGAKLNEIDKFKKTIRDYKEEINSLRNYDIKKLSTEEIKEILNKFKKLFYGLELTGILRGKKIKSKLVAFAKTMHFLLPDLVMPIDRSYTLYFFYGTEQFSTYKENGKNNEKQFNIFKEIFYKVCELSKNDFVMNYPKNKRSPNIPKVIDNAIIGYKKLHG